MGQTKPMKKSKASLKKQVFKVKVSGKPSTKPPVSEAATVTTVVRAGLTTMERLRRELLRRKDEIRNFQHSMEEHGSVLNNEPGDIVDRSEETEVWLKRESMNQHVSDELKHIEVALLRMDSGDFGICEACEEQIPMNRLRARPDATLCLSCQEMTERHHGTTARRPLIGDFA